MCCTYGNGGYYLYWGGGVAAAGGGFGSSEIKKFGGCVDFPGWYDSYGDDCSWYERWENPGCPYWHDKADGGYGTPGEACCHCDGGLELN